MFDKLAHIVITANQADQLPETNAIASTPDNTEYYVDIQVAKDLELLDDILVICPEIQKTIDDGADVVHLSY